MMQLNAVGEAFAQQQGVHAMTDVTGFGLCGHLLEVLRGSGLAATVAYDKVRAVVCVLVLAVQQVWRVAWRSGRVCWGGGGTHTHTPHARAHNAAQPHARRTHKRRCP
jgi:hypothetical protein